jgi:tetratricopeptide (TPR) repeat protein
VVAVIAIAIAAVTSRMAAEQRRDSGELLVGYKLNELRTMLDQAGEPENLDRLREWNQDELAALITNAGPGTPELLITANRLREEGIELRGSGNLKAAEEKFKSSWALFAEVYRRDRNNQTTFFELGQAEFWIGYVHRDRGELDLAEAAFLSYAEITRRLIQLQPKNAEWVLEMAYALTNLGFIEAEREEVDPERRLQYMQSALEYNQIAIVLDPDSEYYRSEIGQSHANLADAQRSVCDLEGALQSRREGLALETELYESDSDNPERQENLALAQTGYARVQAMRGFNDEAREYFQKSLLLIKAAARQDQIIRTNRLLAERRDRVIWFDAMSGRIDEAWAGSEEQANVWQSLIEAGLDNINTLLTYTVYLLDRAWLANERGDTTLAVSLLDQGMAMVLAEAVKKPNNRFIGNALTLASYRYWEITGKLPTAETLSLLPNYMAFKDRTRGCTDASMAIRKEVMLGNTARANDLVAYLLDKGYRDTGFMRICKLYYDCSGDTDAN